MGEHFTYVKKKKKTKKKDAIILISSLELGAICWLERYSFLH